MTAARSSVGRRLRTTVIAVGVLLLPALGMAAGEGGDWRETYDRVLLWVNFLVLVALLYKWLRKPLGRFLAGRRQAVAEELGRLEAEKARVEREILEFREGLESRRAEIEDYRTRLIERGRRQRQERIEEGMRHSQILMDTARQRSENRIRKARDTLRAELVDGAVDLAFKTLPQMVRPDDQKRWADRFVERIDESTDPEREGVEGRGPSGRPSGRGG